MSFQHWQIDKTAADWITVWVDVQQQKQNIFSAEVMSELDGVLDQLQAGDPSQPVLFRSRKPHSFFAGADISAFAQIQSADEAREISKRGQDLFARISELHNPTIALIQGVCLGGGLEMALACNRRLVVNDSSTRIGLPETSLGIIPGWGGTQRLPHVVGLIQALAMILQGQKWNPEKAMRTGLADAQLPAEFTEQDLAKAVDEVLDKQEANQDNKRTWRTWLVNETSFGRSLAIGGTEKRIAQQIKFFPALGKALKAIRLAYQSGDGGYQYEQEAIAELLPTETCQNLVGLTLDREKARNLNTWEVPEEIQQEKITTVAVLGGGTMGAGIAHTAAKNGFQVVLKEINNDALEAARQRIGKTYETLLNRKSITPAEANVQQEAITFSTDWKPVGKAEVVIEAVPEVMDLKQSVFRELSTTCPEQTLLASNTSALSISKIASAASHPEQVAGLHFFNPVHRMDLIEVVQAEQSDSATVAKMIALARRLGKTPILVQDSPGFVVNRVLMPYLDEALKIAIERSAREQDLKAIDQEMVQFGMPMGPLTLLDHVGIDVAAHVAGNLSIVFGENSSTALLLERMKDGGRLGRKSEAGFYNYVRGKRMTFISIKPFLNGIEVDLPEAPATPLDSELTPIQQRLVLAMINEAARCLEENIVAESWMIDLAMVHGTGFAPFRGGPLKLAQSLGIEKVRKSLSLLAPVFGSRFEPSAGLQQIGS